MNKPKTLFEYLYNTIVMQIMTGELAFGDPLPSMRNLSDIYNVGIRTVRDVMQKLKEDGYVAAQPRVGYTVAYQQKADAEQIPLLLSKWDAIMDVVKLMVCVIPDLLLDAAQLADNESASAWTAALQKCKPLPPKDAIRQLYGICGSILALYGNEYLDDLFLALNRFLEVPAIDGVKDPNEAIAESLSDSVSRILECIQRQAYPSIVYPVKKMYSDIGFILNQFYEELMALYPDHGDYSSTQFHWDIQRGREHRYLAIVRDLIHAMRTRQYPPKTYLPSILQLSKQYNVSSHTINQSLSILHDTGLLTCRNHRGNKPTPHKARPIPLSDPQAPLAQELRQYLCSLHLLALFCHNVASLFAEYFSPDSISQREFEHLYSSDFPCSLMSYITVNHPIRTLEHIYSQLLNTADWAYYFSFAWPKQWDIPEDAPAQAIAALWQHDGRDTFSSTLQSTYARMFLLIQDIFLECGYPVTNVIHLPTKLRP